MQCSMNRSCCRVLYCFLILVGFICAVELVFGSLLAVCVVGLFCNVGLCCKCCFYLLSVTIVVFWVEYFCHIFQRRFSAVASLL